MLYKYIYIKNINIRLIKIYIKNYKIFKRPIVIVYNKKNLYSKDEIFFIKLKTKIYYKTLLIYQIIRFDKVKQMRLNI